MHLYFKIFLRTVYIFCFFLLSQTLAAQKETAKWYFGYNAGLDFTTIPPTVITNGKTTDLEGTSSASDALGNLLFYTDGDTVWNKQHQLMANGTGLFGRNTPSQAALIIKQPGNSNIYFVFTVDGQGDPGGLCYSTVNMALAAGMGSVTTKNMQLVTPTTEKLTAVRHCNGKDVWLISHDLNSDHFRAYLINSFGVAASPVTSAIGTIHTYPPSPVLGASQGMMKVSPNGKKLAVAICDLKTFEVFDFNTATGVVSNSLNLGTNYDAAYSVEFSPDGTKLYGTRWETPDLFQWDLCAGSHADIINSKYSITTQTAALSGMQLALDGKIYIPRGSMQLFMATINNPNGAGAACGFVEQGQYIFPGMPIYAVPNFMSSYFYHLPATLPSFTFAVNNVSSCLTMSFTAPPNPTIACAASGYSFTSLEWLFGDIASGAANTSTLSNPVHAFTASGSYMVSLILKYQCGADTIKQLVNTAAHTATVNSNPGSCSSGGSATLNIAGGTAPYSYTWQPSMQTGPVAQNLSSGTHSVIIVDANGCVLTKTLNISLLNTLTSTLNAINSLPCYNSNNGTASVQLAGGTGNYNYNWNNNSQTTPNATGLAAGTHTVIVTDITTNCFVSHTFQIVAPPPLIITITGATVCVNQAINLSVNTLSGSNFYWSGPNSFTSTLQNPQIANSTTVMSGIYTLTVTNAAGCIQTSSVSVFVTDLSMQTASSNTPCAGSNLILISPVSNSYQWLGPNGFNSTLQNPVIQNATSGASGVYTLTNFINASCSAISSVSVTIKPLPLTPLLFNNGPLCEGQNLLLNYTNIDGNYSWSGPLGFTSNQQNPVVNSVSVVNSGIYTLNVTGVNGCVNTNTSLVSVFEKPVINLPTPVACMHSDLIFNASGGSVYQWAGPNNFSSAIANPSITNVTSAANGVYTLNVTNSNNCSATTTLNIIVNALPQASLLAENDFCVPYCAKFKIKNGANAAPIVSNTFMVDNNLFIDTAIKYCFNNSANYDLYVHFKDANQCVNSASLVINAHPKPKADFEYTPFKPLAGIDNVIFTNTSLGEQQITWNWFFINNNGFKSFDKNTSYLFENAGSFPVAMIVKNKWGCIDTIVKSIIINEEFSIYVPNAFTPNEDGANETFYPYALGINKYELTIFDRWGTELFNTKDIYAHWDGSYKGTPCKEDVYVWKISVTGNDEKVRELNGHVTLYR